MTKRGRPRDQDNEDAYRERREKRDPTTKIVAENLEGLIGGADEAGAKFLSEFRKGKTMSPTVAFLDRAAKTFGVPVTAFFVPPDKRDRLMAILRTIGNGEMPTPDQAAALVRALLEARQPLQEGGPQKGEADREKGPTDRE